MVYEHNSTTGKWLLRRVIKLGSANEQLFGRSVALGDNGKLLVVGAWRDASKAMGIDGDREDDSVLWRGAVWFYRSISPDFMHRLQCQALQNVGELIAPGRTSSA